MFGDALSTGTGCERITVKQAIKEGYKPLVVDGIQKVINGYTNLQEIDKKLLIFNNE